MFLDLQIRYAKPPSQIEQRLDVLKQVLAHDSKAAGESIPEEVPTALHGTVRPYDGSWRTEEPLQHFRSLKISIGTLRTSMSRERSMEKGASLGKEAVLAALGWAGEVAAGIGRVRIATFQHPGVSHTDRGTRCTAPALIAATTTEPVSRPSSSLAPLVITARRGKPQSTVTVTNTPCGSISITRPDR